MIYTLEEIEASLIKSDTNDLPFNFIAAAVKVDDDGHPHHAGLIIKLNDKFFLFHYTSREVILDKVPDEKWYFHKTLSFISEIEIPAFLAHCKIISIKAKPKYGYFYGGSYYKDGKYFSEAHDKEFMTCVGFCINVVLGFLETEVYFSYSDWTDDSLDNPEEYLNNFINEQKGDNPEIDINAFKKNLRRIMPSEYVASAFFNEPPIRKKAVDEIIESVKLALIKKRNT